MSAVLNSTLTVQIPGSATRSASHGLAVEACDLIDVAVPAQSGGTAGELEVEVQPGGAGRVQLLMITADAYDAAVTYAVTGGADDVQLDAPQLLAGAGAVGLLGSAPQTITFSNGTDSEIAVRILVGRNATPPAP